jgi:hypothetical protein
LADAGQIERLERNKRRIVLALGVSGGVLLAISALRFVPRLNDALSGQPGYIRILTETLARQLASQTQMQSPVIVEEDEHVRCQPVNAASIPDAEMRGTIYLLTFSEQQHLTCITTYVVPTDFARFPTVRSFAPGEGKNYGPTLLGTVKAVAEDRIFHVYAPEYLKRLHWRYKPHFPLSPNEAESLRSQSFYSGAKPVGNSVSIDFDYAQLRAEIGIRHQELNLALSFVGACCALAFLFSLRRLWLIYRGSSRYCRFYGLKLTPGVFLKENIPRRLNAARLHYFELQHQTQARSREAEKRRALRNGWLESLRSALPNLTDAQLRGRVQECLESELHDLEQVKSLWVEVREQTGLKTPVDKLNILLESVKPFCTEEEFLAGRTEAFAIFKKSGFRAARTFAITMHDQLKFRSREMEELEAGSDSDSMAR